MKIITIQRQFASHPIASSWEGQAGSLSEAQVRDILQALLRILNNWHRHGRWHGMLSLDDVWQDEIGNWQILPPTGTQHDVDARRSGYAAIECYGAVPRTVSQGIRADIYSACAIAWSLMQGGRPPCAERRVIHGEQAEAELERAMATWDDIGLGEAVRHGMALFPQERPKDIDTLRVTLGQPKEVAAPVMPELAPAACDSANEHTVKIVRYQTSASDNTAVAAVKAPQRVSVGTVALVLATLVVGLVCWWQLTLQDDSSMLPTEQATPVGSMLPQQEDVMPSVDQSATPLSDDSDIVMPLSERVPGVDDRVALNPSASSMQEVATIAGHEDMPEAAADMPAVATAAAEYDGENTTAGESGAVAASPASTQVKVNLNISPWAEVYVDGQRKGVSPPLKSIMLAPGTYRIELRNTSQAPIEQRLTVTANGNTSISHQFSSEDNASQD